MGREKPDYRNIISQLNLMFPDHEMLSVEEVMQVMGVKSKTTVRKFFAEHDIVPVCRKVSKSALARGLCG